MSNEFTVHLHIICLGHFVVEQIYRTNFVMFSKGKEKKRKPEDTLKYKQCLTCDRCLIYSTKSNKIIMEYSIFKMLMQLKK